MIQPSGDALSLRPALRDGAGTLAGWALRVPMAMTAARVLIPQVEATPWAHPFLTAERIGRFRAYSEAVWAHAQSRAAAPRPLDCGFAVNMAQNMYKWAKLADAYGARATLYLNPQDRSAISRPEWEEFDGAYGNVHDGDGFLRAHGDLPVRVRCVMAPNEGAELLTASQSQVLTPRQLRMKRAAEAVSRRFGRSVYPNVAIEALRDRSPTVRHESLLSFQGAYPYFAWAELLAQHDVNYITSTPFPAYASGKPYCVFSVGGDLQIDCGLAGDLGRSTRLAFAGARFILASNPHTLGHCRRFGFTNAVYLPYPMDSNTYCPGDGKARREWIEAFGGETFVLSTARLDRAVKGQTDAFFRALTDVGHERPNVRFLFLAWGADAHDLRERAAASGSASQLVVLSPVGKQQLIDYYRSCDIVLDHFVYGYYGTTALEAAGIGKPVVMKLRADQYAALYRGDVAPVEQADTPDQVRHALMTLVDNVDRRRQRGAAMRAWLERTHGEATTVPLMLALLRMAAEGTRLPRGLHNPLRDPITPDERAYHEHCHQRALARD